ncbi:hypothetical protein [Neobacillus mesonae]|uniref:hypothetical protein n=1 Tax=Neobacillus mesonae TaxID=1193713 RepID=UPI00257431B7|nr:hypothetical protein [Neobacillus mesonae]MED4206516.1 hypothetical protein [Neobacillus mesonae]
MKTFLVTSVGAVILAGGAYAVNGNHADAAVQNKPFYQQDYKASYNNQVDVTKLPEYETLAAKVDLTKYHTQIVEDHFNKRIILYKDPNGRAQYKTIFIKETEYVKIIKL